MSENRDINADLLLEAASKCVTFAVYRNIGDNVLYPLAGLVDEFGEYLDALDANTDLAAIFSEHCDVLWYLNQLAWELSRLDVPDLTWGTHIRWMLEVSPDESLEPQRRQNVFRAMARLAGIVKKIDRDGVRSLTSEKILAIEKNFKVIIVGLDLSRPLGSYFYLIDKLSGRQNRGTLHGDGDVR